MLNILNLSFIPFKIKVVGENITECIRFTLCTVCFKEK